MSNSNVARTAQGVEPRSAAHLVASASAVRLGGLALVVVAVLDVIVAWGPNKLFKRVSSGLSLAGAWLRVGYAATFALSINSIFSAVNAAPTDPSAALRLVEPIAHPWMKGQVDNARNRPSGRGGKKRLTDS